MTGLASTAAGHGPDPVLDGPLFGQNQALAVRLADRRSPAGGDQDGDQGSRGRRVVDQGLEGGHVRLRRGRNEPDRLRRRRHVRRRTGSPASPATPRRLHDVAPRAGPRLRLGHAQVVPVVREPAERLLRRRDDRARRVRPRRGPRSPRQLRGRARLRRRRRPDRLAGEARRRAGTRTASGPATSPRSSASTTSRARPRSTRPASTCRQR